MGDVLVLDLSDVAVLVMVDDVCCHTILHFCDLFQDGNFLIFESENTIDTAGELREKQGANQDHNYQQQSIIYMCQVIIEMALILPIPYSS